MARRYLSNCDFTRIIEFNLPGMDICLGYTLDLCPKSAVFRDCMVLNRSYGL
jgi:hypothetical protein